MAGGGNMWKSHLVKKLKNLNFKTMKRFGMLLVMLIFAGTPFVTAQQQATPPAQQPQKMTPVREYIQKNVLPVVKQEREKLISAFTPAEKKELTTIQEELKTFRHENMKPGAGMRGNFSRPMTGGPQPQMVHLIAQLKKIVDAHPKAAAAYKEAIEARKAKWSKDILALRAKNNKGYGQGMQHDNRSHFMFDRLSDPAFALLFHGTQFPMGMRPEMGPGMRQGTGYGHDDPRGMNRPMAMQMRCPYKRMGRNMRYHSHGRGYGYGRFGGNRGFGMNRGFRGKWHPMMRSMTPEVKKALLAYAQKNVFPVLNKERDAFNNVLKNSEKRDIENARKNISGIRAEMKKHRQEMKKGNGQKWNDSTRMAVRLNLEKNMLVVREIALNHHSELQASLNNLKQYLPKWKEGMRHIMFQNMGEKGFHHPMGRPGYGRMMPHRGGMMRFHRKHRWMSTGVRFLLYDPAHPGEQFLQLKK